MAEDIQLPYYYSIQRMFRSDFLVYKGWV